MATPKKSAARAERSKQARSALFASADETAASLARKLCLMVADGAADRELGVVLLSTAVAGEAAARGLEVEQLTEGLVDSFIASLQTKEATKARYSSLEKALRKAALGDLVTAGRLIRESLLDDAQNIVFNRAVVTERERREKARKAGGHTYAENVKDKLKPRNDKIIRIAKDLLASGRGKHELAGILAPQFKISATQVRTILAAGLDGWSAKRRRPG